jgi:hypothetical protein
MKRPPDPVNDPQLPGVPYPFTAENFRIVLGQTVDYIAFVASTYPPEWAEQEIFRAARQLIHIVASEYEASARELIDGAAAGSLDANSLDLSKGDLI